MRRVLSGSQSSGVNKLIPSVYSNKILRGLMSLLIKKIKTIKNGGTAMKLSTPTQS